MRGLSVVVPLFNEAENLPRLHEELGPVLEGLDGYRSEILYVDDGSADGSWEVAGKLAAADPRCRVIRLRRNFGQTAALAAGFDAAAGDVIVTLDADLQNDPRDIPALLERLDGGYDIVNGWRRERKDPWLSRRLPSRLANGLISRVTGVRLRDYGCTLKAYRREVLADLTLYGELHRFIPALASWSGVSVAEVPVHHRPRFRGSSKYGIGRTLRVLIDLLLVKFLLGYAGRPGQLFGMWGLMLTGAGGVLLGYLAVERIFFAVPLGDRPILLVGILAVILGLQVIGIGLLAELITRTYHEGTGRKTYVIRETTGRGIHTPGGGGS